MTIQRMPRGLKPFAYVGDEVERADARDLPYQHVVGHPCEVALPRPGDLVVVGIDTVAFGDRPAALEYVRLAAMRGATVGVHTYDADEPRLAELATQANVAVGKTHLHVLAALGGHVPGALTADAA